MAFNYDARTLKDPTNQILSDLVRQPSQSNFFKGVVLEVINDTKNKKKIQLANQNQYNDCPKNSIVVKIISNAAAKSSDSAIVCFPFFSHLDLPINPGETVWIMSDSAGGETSNFYWMSKVVEPDSINDINYTHSDRKYKKRKNKSTADRFDNQNGEQEIPDFPNGAGTNDSSTLNGGSDAFDKIVNESPSFKKSVKERVPRFTKRPGDVVIQGSNNAVIHLGIATNNSKNEINNNDLKNSGTIDIVAGLKNLGKSIVNTRGFEELDKLNLEDNEGDPDFESDSSRIYVTSNKNFDESFSLKKFKGEKEQGAAIIEKSDHIRIYSRKSLRICNELNNGSYIQMEPDGTVYIKSDNITLESNSINHGQNATESIILGDSFLAALEIFLTQVSALGNPNPAIPIPDPKFIGLKLASETLKSQLQTFKSQKSKIT